MEAGGQRHAPSTLSPGRTRHPLYRRLGGPQGRSGRVRKISPTPGFDPRNRPARSVVAIPTVLSRPTLSGYLAGKMGKQKNCKNSRSAGQISSPGTSDYGGRMFATLPRLWSIGIKF
jgi:hypothetical protein